MKDIEKYKEWLEGQGAEIDPPTNEWEVLRYRLDGATKIIYRDKKNKLSFVYGADQDHQRFNPPRIRKPKDDGKLSGGHRKRRRQRLFERDGEDCWYCGELMPRKFIEVDSPDFPTIEHLVPQSEGGGHAMANLVLAHLSCNNLADNSPLAAKIELRHSLLAKHEQTPPWESVRA